MSRSTTLLIWINEHTMWVILFILFTLNAIFTDQFFIYGNIINILFHSTILAMLALGLGLTLLTGNFDLSIESTMAFSPAVAALIMTHWVPGFSPYLAILITFIIGIFIGIFNGLCIAKLSINPFLQTLSMLIILRGLTLFMIPLSIYNLPSAYCFLGGERIIGNIPIALFFTFFVFVVMHILLESTVFGRSIIAIGGNSEASFKRGIRTARITILTFAISGLLASAAGLLATGRQAAVTNIMGQGMVFEAFAAAVLGGVSLKGGSGSVTGMIAGVLILGIINNSLTLLGVSPYLIYATKGFLIFIAILIDRNRINVRNMLFHREEMKYVNVS